MESKAYFPARKSLARLIAVQALYSEAIAKDPDENSKVMVEKILNQYKSKDFLEDIAIEKSPDIDAKFMRELIEIELENRQKILDSIASVLTSKWTLASMDVIILAILRLASAEIFGHPGTPKKVVIDEYIKICKSFYGEEEAGFINGVLDKIIKSTEK